jgi:hypothetical protein
MFVKFRHPGDKHEWQIQDINRVHQYNTRLACKKSYYLPKIRTNYGKFNIRFVGVKIWNSVQDDFEIKSRSCFNRLLN